MSDERNSFVVTEEVFTSIGADIDAFDSLPKPVREALRESNYEWSAEDAWSIMQIVREQFPFTPQNIFRNITEREIALECARHIRETDRNTREKQQREMPWLQDQTPLSTTLSPISRSLQRNAVTKRTAAIANYSAMIRKDLGISAPTGKKSRWPEVFYLDGKAG